MLMSAAANVAVKLLALVLVMPLAVLVLYAWLSAVNIKTPYGLIAAVLITAIASFYFLKKNTTLLLAGVGSAAITGLVFFLSMLLLLNVFGS